MRILCFGDSNTYGYDPRSYFGGRYPAEGRWTDLLALETGWTVLNAGQNGREIPAAPSKILSKDCAAADVMVVMLGSNDLLRTLDAEAVATRMEAFLKQLSLPRLLLVAPPPMIRGTWVTDGRLLTESRALTGLYAVLAQRLGIAFADAGRWDVELLFDGVHFSEAGHRAFAAGIRESFPRDWS